MKRVLSFGYLKTQLEQRNRALSKAGVEVTAVTTVPEALAYLREHPFDLLIVGPSVPDTDRNRVAGEAKTRKMRTIFLYRGKIFDAEFGDALINADGDPENLLDAVFALTA